MIDPLTEKIIAIVTGDVSGGLAVRDFDEEGAYERWRTSISRNWIRIQQTRSTEPKGRDRRDRSVRCNCPPG